MHTLPTSSTSSRPPLSAYQYHHPLNHASRSTNLSPLAASISTTSSSSHHSSCMGVLPRPSNSDPNSALSPNSLTLQPILDCILPLAPKKCSMPDSASSCDPVFGSETLLAYNQRIPHYNNDSSNAATITQSNPGFSRSEICNSQYLDLTLDDKQIKNQGASQSFQNFTPLHPEAFQSRDVKRRTSKACDHCRKSKCKCTRAPGPDGVIRLDGPCQNCVTNGIECTFNLTSRKRGPPKGYIEAIESRLHRMESLLGQLLHHKDPRTQALLSELIQDQCARDLLMHDLRTASQSGYGAKPRKSWKLAEDNDQLVYHYGAGEDINNFPNLWDPSASLHGLNTDLPSPLPFSASPEYKVQKKVVRGSPVSERNEVNQDRSYRIEDYSANFMPLTIYPGGSSTSQLLQISNLRKPLLKYSLSTNDDSPKSQADSSALTNTKELVGQASLNHKFQVQYHGPSSGLNLIAKFSRNYHNGYWRFPEFVNSQNLPEVDSELGSSQVLCKPIRTFREESELYYRKKQIEYYNLMNPIGVFPEEIGHMNKLLDYYWENVHPIFPILNKLNFLEQFNCISQEVQNVQKHYAQKTKNNEQFRRFSINEIWFYSILKTNLKNQSSEVSIPILLVMFSLASKYLDLADNLPNSITEFSDRECHNEEDTDRYLHKAEESIKIFIDLIDEDQNINLINCQTLLLLSYRRMGSFSLSKSWSYAGMAIRMAQHLGLHKDLKAHHESCPGKFITSQTLQKRKLIWWACVKIDKHLSSCAGKPTMIFERDYDISILIEDENEEADDERGSGIKPEPASPSVKCFNCSVSLSILVGRTLANLYPIRPKIIAESDEALLPLLDQNFARWYIELPNHLIFDPNEKSYSTKKSCVEGKGREEENPKPEVLTLHAQFYTALILLHRPFLEKEYSISHETKILHSTPISSPGKNNPPPYQSHSICAASAKAIKSIFKTFRQIFGFKKISPLMIYYLYSAIAIFAYDSHSTDLDEKYRLESQEDLSVCVNYLLEISNVWGTAKKLAEICSGLVSYKEYEGLGKDLSIEAQESLSNLAGSTNLKKRKTQEDEAEDFYSSNLKLKKSAGDIKSKPLSGETNKQCCQLISNHEKEKLLGNFNQSFQQPTKLDQRNNKKLGQTQQSFENITSQEKTTANNLNKKSSQQLENISTNRGKNNTSEASHKTDLNDLEINESVDSSQNLINQMYFGYF